MQRSSAQGVNSDLGHSISAQVGQILDPEQVTLPLHIGLINPPKSLRRPPALCLYIPDQGLHILAVSPTPGSPVPSPLLLRCLLLYGYFFPAPALGFSPVQMAPSEPLPGCDWLEVPIAAAPPPLRYTHVSKVEDTLDSHSVAPSCPELHRVGRRDTKSRKSFLPSMKATT